MDELLKIVDVELPVCRIHKDQIDAGAHWRVDIHEAVVLMGDDIGLQFSKYQLKPMFGGPESRYMSLTIRAKPVGSAEDDDSKVETFTCDLPAAVLEKVADQLGFWVRQGRLPEQ